MIVWSPDLEELNEIFLLIVIIQYDVVNAEAIDAHCALRYANAKVDHES
ncbi:MAG: hypothetical protein M3270_04545 [Thermoproteota archaeon]|nr:hypothetical protein [Thermoproteota archaeon]